MVYDDAILNYFDVQITQYQTVKKLRQLNSIRYVEPTGYSLPQSGPKSDSGCSTGGETIATADYGTLSTGAENSLELLYSQNQPSLGLQYR